MNPPLCICGCGQMAVALHHIVFQQELRRVAGGDEALRVRLVSDERGMVPVAQSCHERAHSRSRPLPLSALPDEVFEFAEETLGTGRAYNYLRRTLIGEDPRLDALLDGERRAAA